MMTWPVWYRSDGASPHGNLVCRTRWEVGENKKIRKLCRKYLIPRRRAWSRLRARSRQDIIICKVESTKCASQLCASLATVDRLTGRDEESGGVAPSPDRRVMAEQSAHPGPSLEFLWSFFGGGHGDQVHFTVHAESASTSATRQHDACEDASALR